MVEFVCFPCEANKRVFCLALLRFYLFLISYAYCKLVDGLIQRKILIAEKKKQLPSHVNIFVLVCTVCKCHLQLCKKNGKERKIKQQEKRGDRPMGAREKAWEAWWSRARQGRGRRRCTSKGLSCTATCAWSVSAVAFRKTILLFG